MVLSACHPTAGSSLPEPGRHRSQHPGTPELHQRREYGAWIPERGKQAACRAAPDLALVSAGTRPHAALITASLGLPVVLIDTRQRRATAAVLASKRERFQAREPAMITYVTETVALVEALTAVLDSPQPDYREAGRLLSAAHALLRDQVACSTPLIEECVSRVLAAGAYGAKLSGSGHGGCLFALVPDDAVAAVLASVVGLPVHAVALPRSDPSGLVCAPPAARRDAARPA